MVFKFLMHQKHLDIELQHFKGYSCGLCMIGQAMESAQVRIFNYKNVDIKIQPYLIILILKRFEFCFVLIELSVFGYNACPLCGPALQGRHSKSLIKNCL